MIKVQVFNETDNPIEVIAEGDVEDFVQWSNQSKIVGLVEKNTGALFTIPILKHPIKVIQLERDKEEETCNCDNCKNKKQ